MTTGERIRHIRNERGISQKQLSEMCGLSEPAIRNYELGNRKPSAQILDKIAAALPPNLCCLNCLTSWRKPGLKSPYMTMSRLSA